MEDNYTNNTLNDDEVPAKSVEGWIIIITNIHGEAREDYIKEVFEEFGQIRNLHLNLDRRTGFIKGYAFLEFENFVDAKRAIDGMSNKCDIICSTN
ncbi:RNA binding motif protein 8B-related [Plasmodium yoelii yoelii]|uniref:RNA-binding protein 8A n=2 Tax=Plasmodium yoelii yoelii TaxID=73239 RepID=A0AAE9WQT0_PLAYO|nr:RNA binding motif protein 8B-related [Plasmodium yoelii yoelii]WBY58181.1 RNA-binding protein 8A [Plasmodium yoelii yoelii]